ncbi:MAG: M48 family metalloprotease [Lewinellaceae bacterium]|nr:M48 family metalloprotease [Lewinellaceae bacterium]
MMAWLAGVLLLSMRQLGHYFFLSQLRVYGLAPPEERWAKLLDKRVKELQVSRPVLFMESAISNSLITFGHWRPCILAPAGLLAGLTPGEVEALLLHELAHIKRHDYLVNLLQRVVETLLFYHPAIWWLSGKARQLREESCDELVLARGIDPAIYSQALLQVAKFSQPSKYQFVMNASSHLSTRIHKILNAASLPRRGRLPGAFPWLMALLVLTSLGALTGFVLGGRHTVSIAADKMNVLYVGVDNPLTIAVAGIPNEQVQVSSRDVKIVALGEGRYVAQPAMPGNAAIRVSGKGFPERMANFRVKRIPDPVAQIEGVPGGALAAEVFKNTGGLSLHSNSDFDADCSITFFSVVHVPKGQDPIESTNAGANYSEQTARLIRRAQAGDVYYFDNVRCRCPGDVEDRPINALVFKIR